MVLILAIISLTNQSDEMVKLAQTFWGSLTIEAGQKKGRMGV